MSQDGPLVAWHDASVVGRRDFEDAECGLLLEGQAKERVGCVGDGVGDQKRQAVVRPLCGEVVVAAPCAR